MDLLHIQMPLIPWFISHKSINKSIMTKTPASMFSTGYWPWFWPIQLAQSRMSHCSMRWWIPSSSGNGTGAEISNVIGFEMGPDPIHDAQLWRGTRGPWRPLETGVLSKGGTPHGFHGKMMGNDGEMMGKWWGNDGKVMDHVVKQTNLFEWPKLQGHLTQKAMVDYHAEGTWIPADRFIGGKSWTSEFSQYYGWWIHHEFFNEQLNPRFKHEN